MGIVTTIRSMLAAALALVALAAPAAAQTFPALSSRVVDAAHALSPGVPESLSAQLRVLEARTSHQLVVATVSSLGGRSLEDYANRLFRAWGLGGKDRNDGVLLLVVPSERKLRIEVGYGLEGVLPDAIAKTIIEEFMVPQLRAGRIDAAVTAGVEQIGEVISGRVGEVRRAMQARAAAASHAQSSGSSVPWGVLMFFALIPILVAVRVFFPSPARRQRSTLSRGRYGDFDRSSLFAPVSSGSSGSSSSDSSSSSSDSSSSSSSDSFSGGGGSSGGGGASGSW
jgi:uncharacterized protein